MPTLVIYPDTGDGFLRSTDADFADAVAGLGTVTADDTATTVRVGAAPPAVGNGNLHESWQTFLSFDISAVPDGADVFNSALVMRLTVDTSTTNFWIEAYPTEWAAPLSAAAWLTPAVLAAKFADGDRLIAQNTGAAGTPSFASPVPGLKRLPSEWTLNRLLELASVDDTLKLAITSNDQRTATSRASASNTTFSSMNDATVGNRPFIEAHYQIPAPRTYEYAESLTDTVSTTTDTVKTSVTFTPDADSRYLFLWRCNVVQSALVAAPPIVGLKNEGGTWDCNPVPVIQATTDIYPVGGIKVRSFGASPSAITESIVVEGHASLSTTISAAVLLVIKLEADDVAAADDAVDTGVQTSFYFSVQADLPPGRWLVFGSQEITTDTAGISNQTLFDWSPGLQEMIVNRRPRLANIYEPFVAHLIADQRGTNTINLVNTVRITRTTSNAANSVSARNARICALRLGAWLREEVTSFLSAQATTSTSFQGMINIQTMLDPVPHLSLAQGVLFTASTSVPEAELSLQTPAVANTQLQKVQADPSTTGTSNQIPFLMMRRFTPSGTEWVSHALRERSVGGGSISVSFTKQTIVQLEGDIPPPHVRGGSSISNQLSPITLLRPTLGAPVVDGDLLVFIGVVHSSNTMSPPVQDGTLSGDGQPYVLLPGFPQVSGNMKVYVWTRRATLEAINGTVSFTQTQTVVHNGSLSMMIIADAGDVEEIAFDFGDYTAPSVTPDEDDAALLWYSMLLGSSGNGGLPSGYTGIISLGGNPGMSGSWFSRDGGANVATGTVAGSTSPPGGATEKAAMLLAIGGPVAETPDRFGTALLGVTADLDATGRKATTGVGDITPSITPSSAGQKHARGTSAIAFSVALSSAGRKGGLGVGDVDATTTFDSTGTKATTSPTEWDVTLDFDGTGGKKITGEGDPLEISVDFTGTGAKVVRQAGGSMSFTLDFTAGGFVNVGVTTEIAIGFGSAIGHGMKLGLSPAQEFEIALALGGFGTPGTVASTFAEMPLTATARSIALAAVARAQTLEAQSRTAVLDAGEFVLTTTEDL